MRNADRDIFVIFASPVGVKEYHALPLFFDSLLMYPNVFMRNVNYTQYFNETVDEILKISTLLELGNRLEWISDILKFLTLYKYGGFNVDLNMIVQESFSSIEGNFIAGDYLAEFSSAVIHLNNFGIGRKVSQLILE